MSTYEEYIELMSIAYPNSTSRQLRGKIPKHVIVDTPDTFKRLNQYQKETLIESLRRQIAKGKRSLPDKDNDDFIIKKGR